MIGWTIRARGAAAAVALGGVLLISLMWSGDHAPGVCLFHWLTSVPCPSCGMTRAFIALGHGQWRDALALNLASPLVYAAAWIGLTLAGVEAATGRSVIARLWARIEPAAFPAVLTIMAIAWSAQLYRRFLG